MFNAQAGNNEFIEIYNLSSSESVNLKEYKIKYFTSSSDGIVGLDTNLNLPPNSYAVILEGDYDFENGIYKSLIPSSVLIIKIDNNSFGTSGMANSTDRTLYLLNAFNDTIDTYLYSADNQQGFSDEKIILNRDSSSSNWKNSILQYGTPGYKNSVSQKENDLTVSSLSISPVQPFLNDNITINAVVKNKGIEGADNYSLEIYLNKNMDSILTSDEKIFSETRSNLISSDSSTFITSLNNLPAYNYQIIACVFYSLDEDTSNNIKFLKFTVHSPPNNFNDVVINEIMYAPSSGQPEWIELYNKTASPINLKKWKFYDNSTHVNVTLQDKFIPSLGFIILCKDTMLKYYFNIPAELVTTKLPSLNNTGDILCLRDSTETTIDSLEYLPTWGGSSGGRSLERIFINEESIQPENWETSKSKFKATPGKINSLSPKAYDLGIREFKTIKGYGIISEPVRLELKIKNYGLNPSANFLINIYQDLNSDSSAQLNELLTTIYRGSLVSKDSIYVDFKIENFSVGKNYFIAELITSNDDDDENNVFYMNFVGVILNEVRGDLVINEIMYAPISPEPEWIEIYNRSQKSIKLINYQIADATDTIKIINYPQLLFSNEYLVIAKDSSVQKKYVINSKVVFANFPTLNNTFDKIILLDSLNRTIDSLKYSSKWGGSSGQSLERFNFDNSSTDSLNWKSCKFKQKGTPGSINSITKKDFDLEISKISFEPPFPVKGESIKISATIKNTGKQNAQFLLQLFKDTNLDSIPDNLIETSSILNLAGDDSTTHLFQYVEKDLINEFGFAVKIIFDSDQDTSNNFLYRIISPGYLPSSIIVSEIMYLPQGGEPEWIEIYNTTEDSVNLKDWTISDILTTPVKSKIATDNVFIPPHKYLILSKDSTITFYHRYFHSNVIVLNIPVLNNDEDGVILKDSRGVTIDSIHYYKTWGALSGFSLERKLFTLDSNLPNNWGASKDLEMSTPGRINSLTTKKYDLSFLIISSIPEFPIRGDDIILKVGVINNGSNRADNFKIQLYYSNDSTSNHTFLNELSNLTLNASDSSWFISGAAIKNIQSNIYAKAIIIFSTDEDTLNNSGISKIVIGYKKNLILINEIMYDPAPNEPEWFELVNISNETVNLKNWIIGDLTATAYQPKISSSDLFLKTGEFLIITKDSSLFKNYHTNFRGRIRNVNTGTLGNTSDRIIIYDFRDAPIDSLYYQSEWGGKKGFSLERISLDKSTNDSTNWMTSLSKSGSTPGGINSVVNLKGYERNDVIINEIMYDPSENNSEFVEFLNISDDSVDIGSWQLFKSNNSFLQISDISLSIPNGGFIVFAADSIILDNYNWMKNTLYSIANQSSLGLSNSDEKLILKDAKGNTIDSVFYAPSWHNKNILVTKNKSLERISPQINSNDPGNWSTAVNAEGATPGRSNSIYTHNSKLEEKISVLPNPFSPDNDGFEDFTIINYNLKQTTAQVRIKIFDSQGRLVRTLLNNQASGASGSVIFDGLNDAGNALRIGIYIIFLEALNENSGVLETMKTVVVVARKL
jgi:hypothetical protein